VRSALRLSPPPSYSLSLLSPSREMRVPSGNRGRWWTGVPELSRGAATPAEVQGDGAGPPPPTLCSLLLLSLWFSLVLCGFVLQNWFDLWMKGKGGVNWRMVVLWICDAKLDLVHAWDWLGLGFHCGFLAWDLFCSVDYWFGVTCVYVCRIQEVWAGMCQIFDGWNLVAFEACFPLPPLPHYYPQSVTSCSWQSYPIFLVEFLEISKKKQC